MHKPITIGMGGMTEGGQFIGAYYHTGSSDKLVMACNIFYDAVLDIIRENAEEIRGILKEDDNTAD